ncbi:hypothetical protein [Nocardioides speluncae]|uniref:hypothetical protein n=1 Tax=Nocardioides speluncae TaxID=2670337 RepID=UPI0012B17407|nr:hypothetical protein [Nocardioides speluncae]
MKTIRLTDAELALVRNAVHGYLVTFGHDESDIVRLAKSALAKVDAATEEPTPQPASG